MTLLEDYIGEVKKRISEEVAALARGAAPSYDEYTRKVGVIRGLNLAIDILYEIYKSKPPEERD